jgi:hypothetical protein
MVSNPCISSRSSNRRCSVGGCMPASALPSIHAVRKIGQSAMPASKQVTQQLLDSPLLCVCRSCALLPSGCALLPGCPFAHAQLISAG